MESKIKGMTTCKVCGRDFPLLIEEHYIAQDPKATGIVAVLSSTDKAFEYDAIDCPHCGCQNVLQQRKPLACPCDCGVCDECDCGCDEDGEEAVFTATTLEEMVDYLSDFCKEHELCDDKCPLHTSEFKCGRGVWFDEGMTPEQVAAAYKVAKESKNE